MFLEILLSLSNSCTSMIQNGLSISNVTFKAICWIAAVFMIGFWIFNYYQNDDVSAIQYVSFDTKTNIAYPELSICISKPFIYQNLSLDVSAVEYNRYLVGLTAFREEYRRVSFDSVTLNLLEHVQSLIIRKRDENEVTTKAVSCHGVENCSFVKSKRNYVGTTIGPPAIYRCFGFEIDQQITGNIESLMVVFKTGLQDLLTKIRDYNRGRTYLVFNFPGQMIKGITNRERIWKSLSKEDGKLIYIKANSMEVLKRRHKNKEPCLLHWARFDEMVLKKHESNLSCSPPYQKSRMPLCTTMREIADSMYETVKMRRTYGKEPCEEMINLAYEVMGINPRAVYPENLKVIYSYPTSAKVIHQVRSIDLHALIGNIGGYIGLFLGKNYSIRFTNAT